MNCECIDYPVSWDFYRWHCIEQHNFDPGDNEPSPKEEREQPLRTTNISLDSYEQQRRLLLHLQEKLNSHLTSKRKEEPKGIVPL